MLLAFLKNPKWPDTTPAGPGKTSTLPTGAAILAGVVRRPIPEIKRMFGVWILLGILLAVVSLFLRSEIPQESRRWMAFPFLVLGLSMAVAGSFFSERLDHAGRAERIVSYLAHRLGVDLVQITCLAGSAVFLVLAATANALCGWEAARMVIGVSLGLGIILGVIGIWLPRLARLFFRKAGPGTPPADDQAKKTPVGTTETPIRKGRQKPVRKKRPANIGKQRRKS